MVEVGGGEGQRGGHAPVLLELGAEPQGGGPRHSGRVGVTVGWGRAPQLHRSPLHQLLLGGGQTRCIRVPWVPNQCRAVTMETQALPAFSII